MPPITAARSTLADGCTTATNAMRAAAAAAAAARGPTTAAASNTAPHTMVTLAPDTAVRCVSPAARNSVVVWAVTADVSPSTSAGSIAACSDGSTERASSAKPARTRAATRCQPGATPSVGSPIADSTATVSSARVGLPTRARNVTGRPAVRSSYPATDAKTTTRPDDSTPSRLCSDPRNINLDPPRNRGDSPGVTVTVAVAPYRETMGC